MISYEKFKNWEKNDYDNTLSMIVIGYNPTWKHVHLQKGVFDHKYYIEDKKKFVVLLISALNLYIDDNYSAILKDYREWTTTNIAERDLKLKIEKYFVNLPRDIDEQLIEINILNLHDFLELFIALPASNIFPDIVLFSKSTNIILLISHHGTIWIIGEDQKLLKNIALDLNNSDATVIKCFHG